MDLLAQARPIISVVIPMYNEAEIIGETHRRLTAVMATLDLSWEVVYVNDGSCDATLAIVERIAADGPPTSPLLNLSRNFGKEIATTAGLDHARGDAVIVMDADLQDPPEVIPRLVAAWQDGYDTVYAQRRRRDGDSWLKKATAAVFYRLMRKLGDVALPQNVGDFRLMSRRVVDAVQQLRERHRFMKGLFAWVGFPSTAVVYDREPRGAGRTKWSLWKLWNLAIEGITSFTVGAAEAGDLSGPGGRAVRRGVRRAAHPAHAAVRQSGRRLSQPDGGGAVPGRHAARHAGHHRRIPRPRVQRDQAAAALFRGALLSQPAGWGR